MSSTGSGEVDGSRSCILLSQYATARCQREPELRTTRPAHVPASSSSVRAAPCGLATPPAMSATGLVAGAASVSSTAPDWDLQICVGRARGRALSSSCPTPAIAVRLRHLCCWPAEWFEWRSPPEAQADAINPCAQPVSRYQPASVTREPSSRAQLSRGRLGQSPE
jgi:hypothetical protein